MWIRSQDKMNLIEVQGFQICYIKNEDEEYWEIYTIGTSLGKYKSKERAIEVLDEIQNLLIPKVIVNTYNVEKKETAYNKQLIIEPIIADIKVQNNINMFYQMPKE